METYIAWGEKDSKRDDLPDLPELPFDCARLEKGDMFEVWIGEDNGDQIYQLKVEDVHYCLLGDDLNSSQWVHLTDGGE